MCGLIEATRLGFRDNHGWQIDVNSPPLVITFSEWLLRSLIVVCIVCLRQYIRTFCNISV